MEKKLLKDAALCAIKFVEIYTGTDAKTKRYQALKALAELTLADLDGGRNEEECEYTAFEVLEKITSKYSNEETDKRNVNRYLRELSKNLSSHEEMLKDIANENKFLAYPSYNFAASPGGGSGNYSTHFIKPCAIGEAELSENSMLLPEGAIKYYLETIDNLPGWIKWVNNFELSEWRLKFIAGSMILAIIIGLSLYFMFMVVFLNEKSNGLQILRMLFGTSALGLFIFWPFRLWYLCVVNRIISAPVIFQPHDINNAQIECFATEKIRESNGKPVRKLRIVSYASSCPLCKSRVEVENGGKEFHHRLIGRCLEAPTEHIYSFDRVLKVGLPLRFNRIKLK